MFLFWLFVLRFRWPGTAQVSGRRPETGKNKKNWFWAPEALPYIFSNFFLFRAGGPKPILYQANGTAMLLILFMLCLWYLLLLFVFISNICFAMLSEEIHVVLLLLTLFVCCRCCSCSFTCCYDVGRLHSDCWHIFGVFFSGHAKFVKKKRNLRNNSQVSYQSPDSHCCSVFQDLIILE